MTTSIIITSKTFFYLKISTLAMTNKSLPSAKSGFRLTQANQDFALAQRIWETQKPLRLWALRTQLPNRSAQSGVACELLWLRSSHGLLWSGAPRYNEDSQTALRTR